MGDAVIVEWPMKSDVKVEFFFAFTNGDVAVVGCRFFWKPVLLGGEVAAVASALFAESKLGLLFLMGTETIADDTIAPTEAPITPVVLLTSTLPAATVSADDDIDNDVSDSDNFVELLLAGKPPPVAVVVVVVDVVVVSAFVVNSWSSGVLVVARPNGTVSEDAGSSDEEPALPVDMIDGYSPV